MPLFFLLFLKPPSSSVHHLTPWQSANCRFCPPLLVGLFCSSPLLPPLSSLHWRFQSRCIFSFLGLSLPPLSARLPAPPTCPAFLAPPPASPRRLDPSIPSPGLRAGGGGGARCVACADDPATNAERSERCEKRSRERRVGFGDRRPKEPVRATETQRKGRKRE